MTDIDRGRIGGGDEDRLPWLEPVEDEQPVGGVSASKLIAAVVVALLALGLVVGGIFWLRERSGPAEIAGGDGDLIAAPKGDYKVAPNEPGGMNVAGEGDATFAASQGTPVDAAIDISKQPEAPVAAGPRGPAAAAPVKTVSVPASTAVDSASGAKPAAPVTKPATPVSTPKPAPEAGGGGEEAGAEARTQGCGQGHRGCRWPGGAARRIQHRSQGAGGVVRPGRAFPGAEIAVAQRNPSGSWRQEAVPPARAGGQQRQGQRRVQGADFCQGGVQRRRLRLPSRPRPA